jgi:hypothetical protein
MTSSNLPGLTPIAILILSAALVGLVSIGMPILLTTEPPKLAD